MKTIGLIGGMSWESTLEYYRVINRLVAERLGGLHSAKIAMYSVDFDPLAKHMHKGEWDPIAEELARAAKRVQAAGAELLLICTNTMHLLAETVQAAVSIPLVHIADATGAAVRQAGLARVGLLGTASTMEKPFLKGWLADKYGLDVLVPEAADRELVSRVIFDELCKGELLEASRNEYLRVIGQLQQAGAQGVVLGCTEIPLLVEPKHTDLPLFDTTTLHAAAAVDLALGR